MGRLKYKHDQALAKIGASKWAVDGADNASVPLNLRAGSLFVNIFFKGLFQNQKFRNALSAKNLLDSASRLPNFQSFIHLRKSNPEFRATVDTHADDTTKQHIRQFEDITNWEDTIAFL